MSEKNIPFPYEKYRKGQKEFIDLVYEKILKKENALISAPTGVGKTISAVAPSLFYAIENNKTLICLTSRQTQVNQILKAVKDFSKVFEKEILVSSFIGKGNMCVHSLKENYPLRDFNTFCENIRKKGDCSFYKNFKSEKNEEKIHKIIKKSNKNFLDVEKFNELCKENVLCPYEVACVKVLNSNIIICDYNYLFSWIKDTFLNRIQKDLSDLILVLDEAHNLPDRIRNASTHSLSTQLLESSIKEIKSFIKEENYVGLRIVKEIESIIKNIYMEKIFGNEKEAVLPKSFFLEKLKERIELSFENILSILDSVNNVVSKETFVSHTGKISRFLNHLFELDETTHIFLIEKNVNSDKTIISLKIKCFDCSKISSSIVNSTHSSIFMSATLNPLPMFKDILDVKNCIMKEFESPFPKENHKTLIVDDVTTKYEERTDFMFKKIAKKIDLCLRKTQGKNTIIFFPSYELLNKIYNLVDIKNLNKEVFIEKKFMKKEEKENYIKNFKNIFSVKKKVLFAVTQGSFSEGLDLPEEMLEVVILVGVPLGYPDLFTNRLIDFYDKKFKKGREYGYFIPAMTSIIQAAGRCIRSEKDKGIIILMDKRFNWTMYNSCFPKHWNLQKSLDLEKEITEFFD